MSRAHRSRDLRWVALGLLLGSLLCGGYLLFHRGVQPRNDQGGVGPAPKVAAPKIPRPSASPSLALLAAQVRSRMSHMTVSEKVGQLFMVSFYGRSVHDPDAASVENNLRFSGAQNVGRMVTRYHLGGVIYMGNSGNLIDPRQIATLSNALQHLAAHQEHGAPLLIATDQEGGAVTRIGPPAAQFPGNMALGADGRTDDTYAAARAPGTELRAMGINMELAPVADVNVDARNPVIGVRSFGDDPQRVAALTRAAVEGYQSAGVAATAKHFPGHGDTDTDSHLGLPVVRQTLRTVERVDLPPFEAAIAAGTEAVMVGHLDVPSLDPSGRPASLSHAIITRWLRQKLGFKGVVITDALGMAGARVTFSAEQVPVQVIKAGGDMLLMPPDLSLAFHAVLGAVRSGQIPLSRLNASVSRILLLKARLGLLADPYMKVAKVNRVVGLPRDHALALRIAKRSITLVKLQPGILPLHEGERVLLVGSDPKALAVLGEALVTLRVAVRRSWPGAGISTALSLARTSDVTIVATDDAWKDASQQALVDGLRDSGSTVIAVGLGDPYDIAYFPSVRTYLATYSALSPSMRALAAVLVGKSMPSGRLPVSIRLPGSGRLLYRAGSGLRGFAN